MTVSRPGSEKKPNGQANGSGRRNRGGWTTYFIGEPRVACSRNVRAPLALGLAVPFVARAAHGLLGVALGMLAVAVFALGDAKAGVA